MEYLVHTPNGKPIAEVTSGDVLIRETQDMLDLMANVPARKIVIRKTMLDETFFDLKSGLAGEILQKVSNYGIQLAIVGDFTRYTSRSLRDFIRESNRSNQVVFVDTVEEAVRRFAA